MDGWTDARVLFFRQWFDIFTGSLSHLELTLRRLLWIHLYLCGQHSTHTYQSPCSHLIPSTHPNSFPHRRLGCEGARSATECNRTVVYQATQPPRSKADTSTYIHSQRQRGAVRTRTCALKATVSASIRSAAAASPRAANCTSLLSELAVAAATSPPGGPGPSTMPDRLFSAADAAEALDLANWCLPAASSRTCWAGQQRVVADDGLSSGFAKLIERCERRWRRPRC